MQWLIAIAVFQMLLTAGMLLVAAHDHNFAIAITTVNVVSSAMVQVAHVIKWMTGRSHDKCDPDYCWHTEEAGRGQ